ncbi:MAG: hypothetical protein RID91_20865 [Azospirillaceae bacterium]
MTAAPLYEAGTQAALVVTRDEAYAVDRLVTLGGEIPMHREAAEALRDARPLPLAEALARFAISDKGDLAEAGTDAFACDERFIALFSETSGTTGAGPLLTPRGRDELRWNGFNQMRAYLRHLRPGRDRAAILHPVIMSPYAEVSAWALREAGVPYLRLFPIPRICEYPRLKRVFEDYALSAIMTTPTLAYKLLYELDRLGGIPDRLDKLLLTGELLTRANLDNFDRILGKPGAARAFVHGSSEAATTMYGMPDATYRGYVDDFVFEILPTGEPWEAALRDAAPAGAVTGELLVTWLQDGILPLVRYNSKDVFTVWRDDRVGEWVFQAEGRRTIAGLGPDRATRLDEAIFGASVPVVHWEARIGQGGGELTVITLSRDADRATDGFAREVAERAESAAGFPIDVEINPTQHSFFDFSPLAKTSRIEAR